MRIIHISIALGVLFGVLLMQPVAAQPGCNGTPTPTPEGDTNNTFIQGPCPTPSPTITPLAPTRGASSPEEGRSGPGDEFNYRPSPEAYDYPIPEFPALSSPTAPSTYTPVAGLDIPGADATGTAAAAPLGESGELISTIEAVSTESLIGFNNPDGTELDIEAETQRIILDLTTLFGYIKGIDPNFWGRGSIFIVTLIFGMVWVTVWRAILYLLPLFSIIIGILRRALAFLLRFPFLFRVLWRIINANN